MPVHQVNQLTGQSAFDVRHKFIEIEDVLCAAFAQENVALLTDLQIDQKPGAGLLPIFVTLQDVGTDNVPLTAVSSLMPALYTLVLLSVSKAIVITVNGAIGCCLGAAELAACTKDG